MGPEWVKYSCFGAKKAYRAKREHIWGKNSQERAKMPLLRSRGDESLYLEERWSEMGKYFYFWSLNAQNRQKNVCIWGPNGQRGKRIPIFGKFFKPKFPSLSRNSILRAQIPFSEPKFLSLSPNSLKRTQIPNSEPNILHQAQSLVALMATFSLKYQRVWVHMLSFGGNMEISLLWTPFWTKYMNLLEF